MRTLPRTVLITCLATLPSAQAQAAWGTQGSYLTRNGEPVYLSGANYTVSDGWMMNLPKLTTIALDADMAALQRLGVNHLRFFPLWPLTQPAIGSVDEHVLQQIDRVVASAGRHQISLQISPITGWMSGAVLLPRWAVGDLFRDPAIIAGEQLLCRTLSNRYQNSPAVLGYDFGNETNVLADRLVPQATRGELRRWMEMIYSSFKTGAPGQLVADGIGTGYSDRFDIRDIAETSDYLAPHSYPYFHGTVGLDPWYGQRNSYSPNFIIHWCKMVGKPVLLQEFGCSEGWLPAARIGANLRLNYLSTWADGAAGFIWWGSHDIDPAYRLRSKDLLVRASIPSFAEGRFDEQEYHTGLLTVRNSPKEYAAAYAACIKEVNRLGLGWRDELPVAYIVVSGQVSFNAAMHKLITAFALAKQVHFQVRLCYEGTAIPSDAAAVIIPGLKLRGQAKAVVSDYLNRGGQVYQSWENDFGPAIRLGDKQVFTNPAMVVDQIAGQMEVALPMHIPGRVSFRQVSSSEPARTLVSFARPGGDTFDPAPKPGQSVFLSQSIGQGTFYYFAGNLESDLAESYDPWPKTNAELLYSTVRPRSSIEVDNKYVELYVKRRGTQRLLLLLNHSEKYQHLTVTSDQPIRLTDEETGKQLGTGQEIVLLLKPAEVVIAVVGDLDRPLN
jgi:hypothetical protein